MKGHLSKLTACMAVLLCSTAFAADSKHITTQWVWAQSFGLGTDVFQTPFRFEADFRGAMNGYLSCEFDEISYRLPRKGFPEAAVLGGAGKMVCELGTLETVDEVELILIEPPCIYMWVGRHYVCPPGGEGYPRGKLVSYGLMLIDPVSGDCFVETQVVGQIQTIERPLTPVIGPNFGE